MLRHICQLIKLEVASVGGGSCSSYYTTTTVVVIVTVAVVAAVVVIMSIKRPTIPGFRLRLGHEALDTRTWTKLTGPHYYY